MSDPLARDPQSGVGQDELQPRMHRLGSRDPRLEFPHSSFTPVTQQSAVAKFRRSTGLTVWNRVIGVSIPNDWWLHQSLGSCPPAERFALARAIEADVADVEGEGLPARDFRPYAGSQIQRNIKVITVKRCDRRKT
jgi:hypothetical protein